MALGNHVHVAVQSKLSKQLPLHGNQIDLIHHLATAVHHAYLWRHQQPVRELFCFSTAGHPAKRCLIMSHHGSDPDLHRAISLRPSPFHAHPEPSTRVAQLPDGVLPVLPLEQSKPGASTSYEVAEAHDPVSRPAFARNASDAEDIEGQRLPSYTSQNDPLHLASRIKSAEQLDAIQANTSRKRQGAKDRVCAPIAQTKDAIQTRRLRGFYEEQNEKIERMLKPVDEHRREAKEEAGADHLQYKIAVYGSFAANVILAGLQLYGAISSGSLSLFTTMADALFDPLSNLTLILCNRAVNRVDPRKFPAGKARIETAGNICFCFLMCSVSFILIVMSARDIAAGSDTDTKRFHPPAVIAVGIAFATKFALFLYCWSLRNKYSSIRILWEDHRNDLFINGYVAASLVESAVTDRVQIWCFNLRRR